MQTRQHGRHSCRAGEHQAPKLPCVLRAADGIDLLHLNQGRQELQEHVWVSIFTEISHSIMALLKSRDSIDAGLEQSPSGQ